MRNSTRIPLRNSYVRKTLPFLLAVFLLSFAAILKPTNSIGQSCSPNSFAISNVESGFFQRDNQTWTYIFFFVKNNNQNGISHISFTLPTTGGCAPGYLNTAVTGWSRGQYSTTKPVDPITNSLTMVYGKDNSCSATKQQDVLKISQQELNKTTGMWVRLELKGTWEFANDATINFKFGNDCCTQALGTSGGGSGFFGCYWDCALEVTANYSNILCFGGNTTVTAVITGAAANPAVQYRLDNGEWQTSAIFPGVLAGNHKIDVKQGPCVATYNFIVTQPASAVDLSVVPVDVKCFGATTGSITATGSGGVGPYQYKLDGETFSTNNVFSGLAAGTYTVYVKDANDCELAKPAVIKQPGSAVDLTLTPVDVQCYGEKTGSITATGSGGVGPYEYKLEGGEYSSENVFNELSAGTYTVYVKDANDCVVAKYATINQPGSAVDLTLAPVDVKCYGENTGSITATGSGGVEPYEYKLEGGQYSSNNVFSDLIAGTYTIYVKDANDCVIAKSAEVKQPGSAVDLELAPVDVKCYGENTGSITATGSGGVEPYEYKLEGFEYSSNNVFSDLIAGTYTIYVKDANDCVVAKSATIGQPGSAVDLTLTPVDVKCFGENTGSITATGSGGVGPYEYKLEGGQYSSENVFNDLIAGTYTIYVKDANDCVIAKSATIGQPGSAVDLTLTPVDVKCFGENTGSITATGSGGVGPYEYKLEGGQYSTNNVFSDLIAGTYTIYVMDANECVVAKSATISQPESAVDLSLTPVDVKCYGEKTGTITATGSGGVGPYEYKLDEGQYSSENIFSGLFAGTYTVYVKDAHDCVTSKPVTIGQPGSSVDLSLTPVDVNCFSESTGSITATGSGGVPPYEFKLNEGAYSSNNVFEDLAAGTYTVYVKDANDCVAEKTIPILQPGSSVALSLLNTDVACFGANTGSIKASGSGGVEPYEYRLSTGVYGTENSFTGLTAGTYTVYIRDANGCETFETATLVEPGAPVTLELKSTDVKCHGEFTGSIKAEGSGGSGDYQYKLEGGEYSTDNVFDELKAGTYTVYVKDKNDCETSEQITIEEPQSSLSLKLTPADILCNGEKTGSIIAEGSGGTAPYKYQLEDGGFTDVAQFDNLPPSTYTIYVQDANGCETSEQVTITEPPVLNLELVVTDVDCKGYESGMIKATGSGGTGTLEYKLDNGTYSALSQFENLVAGTYSVYVKDENGCVISKGAEITEPLTTLTLEAIADKGKVCTDEKTTVTLTAAGGTGPYQYKYDNGSFGNTTMYSLGAGTHPFTVRDDNGCEAKTSVTILSEACGNFCTYTQGYFGNDAGLSTNPDGGGTANYKDGQDCVSSRVNNTIKFALASPSLPAKAGNIELSGLTPDQIISFLPGGGPSGMYTGLNLPSATIKNALLAQLLTLALNMGLNSDLAEFTMPESGELWTQKASDCGSGSTVSTCNKYSFPSGKGWTVQAIYDAASNALINGAVSNSERSNWTATLDAINRGFDECARVCAPVVDPALLLAGLVESERPRLATPSQSLKVKAYPNPFTDRIFINFTSPVAGKAVVEIFDMSGRKLAEINKGQVNAYAENKVEYPVPSSVRSAIIYKVSVGNYSITGRMIAPIR